MNLIIFGVFLIFLLIFFFRIKTKHKGFFNFIRIIYLAYKEKIREIYLFIKLEVYPYFTGKTLTNKPYDYSLWIRWKWKALDKFSGIGRKFIYFWFFLMFFNIYNNGALFEIYAIFHNTWLPFFLLLCRIPIFNFFNCFVYFNANFFKVLSFVF